MSRYRPLAALGAAIIALPPYGDETLGLALIGAVSTTMDDTTSSQRDPRRSGGGAVGVPKVVAFIVIGALVLLALQVGGLRGFVQH